MVGLFVVYLCMRSLFILLLVLLLTVPATTFAQTGKAEITQVQIDNWVHDFGSLDLGVPATHAFQITNTGEVPLIINEVVTQCGCTATEWTREPILPGNKGFVKATYNSATTGRFNKAVTIKANIPLGTKVLVIKGDVATKEGSAGDKPVN
jgi:hypothetical protein